MYVLRIIDFDLTLHSNDYDERYASFISTIYLVLIYSVEKYEYLLHQEHMNLV